jgi:hypothetical protein
MTRSGDVMTSSQPVAAIAYATPVQMILQPRRRPVLDGILIALWLGAVVGLIVPMHKYVDSPFQMTADLFRALLEREFDFEVQFTGFLLPVWLAVMVLCWRVSFLLRPIRPAGEFRVLFTFISGVALLSLAAMTWLILEVLPFLTVEWMVPVSLPILTMLAGGLTIVWLRRGSGVAPRLTLLAMGTVYSTPVSYLLYAALTSEGLTGGWLLIAGLVAWAIELIAALARAWDPR